MLNLTPLLTEVKFLLLNEFLIEERGEMFLINSTLDRLGFISKCFHGAEVSWAQEHKSVFLNPTCWPVSFLPWAKINSRTYFNPAGVDKPPAPHPHPSYRQDYGNQTDQISSETLEDVKIDHELVGNVFPSRQTL